MSNIQHPEAQADLSAYPDAITVALGAKVDKRGTVGYLGGLPGIR
jgi:uncharacterized protein